MNSIRHSNPRSIASVKGIIFAHFRWVICALLFFGMTKNYMDRQVLAVLKINLQQQFGWNEIQYGHLVFAFQTAYGMGMLVVGRFIDRLGTRVGYAVTIAFWSLASVAHGFMNSRGAFCAGLWRIWSVSCEPEGRRGMVPEEGTRAGHRNL
jgi:sugar phosphate permease